MKITSHFEIENLNYGSISVGDSIYTPDGLDADIISIQEQGEMDCYEIELNNNKKIRTANTHFNPVCFRQENKKKIWDNITTQFIIDNFNKYKFEWFDESNYKDFNDFKILLKALPCHEYEPSDDIEICESLDDSKCIKSIKYIGKETCKCISLNDPLGLFYAGDDVITHNSTFTMLALLYIACHFALMRDPWKFFGKSRTTVFIIALCAVTQGKAKEIYNEPLRQLIESASFWHWCRTHQEMLNEEKHLQESDIIEYIPWTTAVDAAQPLNSKVYLPDGTFKKMGDLQIGDEIASPTSGTTIVEGFPFEGETDIYEIELDDGRKARCSLHHKWIVAWEKDTNGNWIWKEVTTEFMLSHEDLEFEIYEGPKTKIIKEKSLDNCN